MATLNTPIRSTSGYSKSDPNRVNNSSLALTLIGIFLLGLPWAKSLVLGQMHLSQDKCTCPGTNPILFQTKTCFIPEQNLLCPRTTSDLSRDKCFSPRQVLCHRL